MLIKSIEEFILMRGNYKGFRTILSISLVLVAVLAQAVMPPHSFLQSSVNSTNELVSQVASNPQVLDRYQRHFAWSKSQILDYLNGLRVGRLQETKVYNVYLVREDGMIDLRPQNLKAGTKVFIDSTGRPILVMACGNPMIPPKTPPVDMVNRPVNDEKGIASLNPGTGGPSQPVELEVHAYPEPSVSPIPQIALVTPVVGQSSQGLSLISGPVSLLAFLPLIGGHGGGNAPQHHTPVPEPATLAVLGLGGAILAARKRTKK